MYITNNPEIARIAEDSGVDRIFIDLEINGKEKRQGHLDTVISRHSINDVKIIKEVLNKSELLVRVNPIYEDSKNEVDKVINDGANIVMLPYFKTKQEVKDFLNIVNGRAKTCLLCETPEAVKNLDEILELQGIDEIHIGLNDLHLGYGMDFMFELLADGTVEKICNKIKNKNIKYGFGGIARVGMGTLPAENILTEHYRLGSSMVILSRAFCNTEEITDKKIIEELFETGIKDIRKKEFELQEYNSIQFEENRKKVINGVSKIVEQIKNKE
ncbi:MAG: aldolase/citrate lyase family protein [Clostridia bacterium]|nr:aldolase/citrate lyase family protein [Clostridia bacterium]